MRKDGSVYRGRPEDTVGAHAGNNNYDSIGICFEGSFDREQMPEVQRKAGAELVAYLKQKYNITAVQRHKDVNATGCPGGSFPFEAIAYGGSAAATPVQTVRTANDTAVTLPLLAKNSGGNAVRAVQALLNGLGHNAGTADGLFGDNTAGAVKRFQAASGIAADGIVGRDTWHKLLGI